MAKFFTTSEDIAEVIEKKFNETGLSEYGITLKLLSLTKAKEVIKVSKASAATEFIVKKDGMLQLFVYEAAFDRLSDEAREMLVEMAFSNVSYDIEKDKLNVDTNPFNQIYAMRRKYGNVILDNMELASIVMNEIEEEEKERKQAEKEAKKSKKNN